MPLLLLFFIGYSYAARNTVVEGIRYSSYESHTRVVIDLKGPVEFNQNRIHDPDRVFFDLKNTSLSRKIKKAFSVNDNAIKKVRVAQFKKDMVRVVFDLNKIKNFYAFILEKPSRLVIDVYPQKGNKPIKNQKQKKKTVIKGKSYEIKTVVIDPGHGGKDPGAVGPRGLREKDITLSVGKKLGKILKQKHGMKVLYTRKRDKFIPLNERTELANGNKADLFISVHVNASKQRSVRGIETYFLNWTNENQAMKVAARENGIPLWKMKKMKGGLQMILQDLARSNKKEESMRLAHSVQSSMVNTLKKKYRKIEDLGVKYALFYVLVGAEMPSILVEISFISNREEERLLSGDRYKTRIAEAIASGIGSYIMEKALVASPDMKHREVSFTESPVSVEGPAALLSNVKSSDGY